MHFISCVQDTKPPSRTESPLDAEDHIPLSMLSTLKPKSSQLSYSAATPVTSPKSSTSKNQEPANTDGAAVNESRNLTSAGVVAAKATWSVPQAPEASMATLNKPKHVKPLKKLGTDATNNSASTSCPTGKTKTLSNVPNPLAISDNTADISGVLPQAQIKTEPKAQPETVHIKPAHCVLKAPMPLNVLGPCHPEKLTAAQQSPWKVRLHNKYPDPAIVESGATTCKISDLKRAIQDDQVLDLSAKKQKTIPSAHGEWKAPNTGTCGAIDLTVGKNQPLSLVIKPQPQQQQQEEPLNFSTTKKHTTSYPPPPLVHRDQVRKVQPPPATIQHSSQVQNYNLLQKSTAVSSSIPLMPLYMPSQPTAVPHSLKLSERSKVSPPSRYPLRPSPVSAHSSVGSTPRLSAPTSTPQCITAPPASHMWSISPSIPMSHMSPSALKPKPSLPSPSSSRTTDRSNDRPPHTFVPSVPNKQPSPKGSLFIDLTRDQPKERIISRNYPPLRQAVSRQPRPAHSTSTLSSMHSAKFSTSHFPMDMTSGLQKSTNTRPSHDMSRMCYDEPRQRQRIKQEKVSWTSASASEAVFRPSEQTAYSTNSGRAPVRSTDMLTHRPPIIPQQTHQYAEKIHRQVDRAPHSSNSTRLLSPPTPSQHRAQVSDLIIYTLLFYNISNRSWCSIKAKTLYSI